MSERIKCYVAGPISQGNQFHNVRRAILAGIELWQSGHYAVYLPHLTALAEFATERMEYEDWLAWDNEWIPQCDVCLRLPGPSKGSDLEEEFFRRLGKPVVRSYDELEKWRLSREF